MKQVSNPLTRVIKNLAFDKHLQAERIYKEHVRLYNKGLCSFKELQSKKAQHEFFAQVYALQGLPDISYMDEVLKITPPKQ